MNRNPVASVLRLGVMIVAGHAPLCPAAAAAEFSFSYFLPPGSGLSPFSVSASGTFATSGSTIIGITGVWDGLAITGLLAPGSFAGNDNLLFFPMSPFLDNNGVSFTVSSPFLGDDGFGNVNLFLDNSGLYTENTQNVGSTDILNIAPITAPGGSVPEPTSIGLAASGLLAVAYLRRRSS